jgi:hypothetical protein
MSDQDIMPRYRMTPPARGRPPVDGERGALQLSLKRAEAKARGATFSFATRAFAVADVGVTESLAVESIEPCGPCGENEGVVVGLW